MSADATGFTGTMRSTMGQQPLGRYKSSPIYGFGASTREQAQKVFVSQEHTALATAGKAGPGPIYQLPPSVGGKQPDGRMRDPPSWGFGSGSRTRSMKQPQVPGPQAYSMQDVGAVGGKQADGRKKDAPMYSFGSATRANVRKVFISTAHQKTDMHGMDSPGPGVAYEIKPSIGGHQPESKTRSAPCFSVVGKPNIKADGGVSSPGPASVSLPPSIGGKQPDGRKIDPPVFSFGSGTREQREKVYVGPGHAGGDYGKFSPGPFAPYEQTPAVGKQVSSTMRQSPFAAFSKEDRWARHNKELKMNNVPGPGAY